MIFVAVGTHPEGFERMIRRLDEIAPQIKEKIVIQRGFTKYKPKNCESFDFSKNLDPYYDKARLVIVQSATSLLEISLKYKKPVITVPRQKIFKEHLNDHQIEFGVYFAKKTGIKCIINIKDLTPKMLKSYNSKPKIDDKKLKSFREYYRLLLINLNNNY